MLDHSPILDAAVHRSPPHLRIVARGAVTVIDREAAVRAVTETEIVRALMAGAIRGLEADVAALMGWGAGFTDALIDAQLDAMRRQRDLFRTLAAAVAADPSLLVQDPARHDLGFGGPGSEDGIPGSRRAMVRFAVEGLLLFSLTLDRSRHRTLKVQLRGKLRELVACGRASLRSPGGSPGQEGAGTPA